MEGDDSVAPFRCALTDGNLSRHLSVLEKAKMVGILKGHDRHRPQTICRITANGRIVELGEYQ